MPEQSNQNWERIFELFKLEYEQAAERFENIYKAIWQIFSYMSILAAGILTFGSRSSSLSIEAIVSIALAPLVFWFLAIYVPMNHYGTKTSTHLKEIEENFNKISKDFCNPSWELKHYSNFATRKTNSEEKVPWRVKQAIYTFGVIILIAWVIFLFYTILHYIDPNSQSASEKIELKLEPVEVTMQQPQLQKELDSLSKKIDSKVIMQEPQLQKLQNKLDNLSQQINSIELLIQDIKENSNQQ